MIICIYEDREAELIGVQLLLASLARHVPDIPVQVTCPVATPALQAMVATLPGVTLDPNPALRGMGWDVKPTLLLQGLDAGHDAVLWLDSDIIVTADFRRDWNDSESLVVTEERPLKWRHTRQRIEGWGFTVGRRMPAINSCLVRVRPHHRALLEDWRRLLASSAYQAARTLPWQQRSPHLLGDQDVLTALLGSTAYAELPIQVLRRGRQIVQHFHATGYPPGERLRNLIVGMPALVHTQGPKPWQYHPVPSLRQDGAGYFQRVNLETSPYAHYARQYREQITAFPACFDIATLPGRVSWVLGAGTPSASGLIQSLVAAVWSQVARVFRIIRRRWA